MDLQLQGKRALISGSTAGIGYAIAQELAAEGVDVVLNGRSSERLAQAQAQLQAAYPLVQVQGIAADLGTSEGVKQLLDNAPSVDILVNNLGIFDPRPFADINDAEWQHFFDVNVMSGVRLSRHYLPQMLAQHWGRIIFISSESGICPPAEMVHYGMSKSAQLSIARGLAETCVGTAVTVNSVLPGPTRTEGVGEFFTKLAAEAQQSLAKTEQAFFANARPTSILKRFLEPREIATLVTYLCSPLASATNGAALRAEGGIVRSLI